MKKLTKKQQKLVADHLRWADIVASKYWREWRGVHRSTTFADLKQDALIGLIHASTKYDETRGKFTSYSYQWMRHKMQLGVSRYETGTNSGFARGLPRITKIPIELDGSIGCESKARWLEQMKYHSTILFPNTLRRALKSLSERSRKIVIYHSCGYTFTEIAKIVGSKNDSSKRVSRQAVQETYNQAIRQIQKSWRKC